MKKAILLQLIEDYESIIHSEAEVKRSEEDEMQFKALIKFTQTNFFKNKKSTDDISFNSFREYSDCDLNYAWQPANTLTQRFFEAFQQGFNNARLISLDSILSVSMPSRRILDGYVFSVEELIHQASIMPDNIMQNPHLPGNGGQFTPAAKRLMEQDENETFRLAVESYQQRIQKIRDNAAELITAATYDAIETFLNSYYEIGRRQGYYYGYNDSDDKTIEDCSHARQLLLEHIDSLSREAQIAFKSIICSIPLTAYGHSQNVNLYRMLTHNTCAIQMQTYYWYFLKLARPNTQIPGEIINHPQNGRFDFSASSTANPSISGSALLLRDDLEFFAPMPMQRQPQRANLDLLSMRNIAQISNSFNSFLEIGLTLSALTNRSFNTEFDRRLYFFALPLLSQSIFMTYSRLSQGIPTNLLPFTDGNENNRSAQPPAFRVNDNRVVESNNLPVNVRPVSQNNSTSRFFTNVARPFFIDVRNNSLNLINMLTVAMLYDSRNTNEFPVLPLRSTIIASDLVSSARSALQPSVNRVRTFISSNQLVLLSMLFCILLAAGAKLAVDASMDSFFPRPGD